MRKHFDTYVSGMLDFVRLNCEQTVPVPELCAVSALCKLLGILTTEENGFVKDPPDPSQFEYYSKLWFLFW